MQFAIALQNIYQDSIEKNVPSLRPEHYMYLGRELQKAEVALEENKKYIQGGC